MPIDLDSLNMWPLNSGNWSLKKISKLPKIIKKTIIFAITVLKILIIGFTKNKGSKFYTLHSRFIVS